MRSARHGRAIVLASTALAISSPLPRAQAEDAQGAFGTGNQILIVQAEQFTGRQQLASGDLQWSTEGYYSSSASATPSAISRPCSSRRAR